MANNYTEILALANKNNMGLSNTIKRDYGIPLDYSSVQETYEAALNYAKTSTLAYIGQPISVGDTLYIVTDEANGYLKAVGTKPTGDGESITVDDNGVVSMFGFKAAADAMLPQKKVTIVDGKSVESIEWITIADLAGSTDTNTKTEVKAADGSAITVTPAHDDDTDTYTYTLDVQFPAIPEYSVTREVGEDQVTYKVTKDGTQVGEAIVVPNAYNDEAIKERLDDLEAIDHSVYALGEDLDDVVDRLDIIEGEATVEGSIKKVLADAKAYADGLAGNYDVSGAAATAEANAKAYTDEEIVGLELAYTENKIQLSNKAGTVVAEFDASVFVQDSFLEDVKYKDGKIKFTWTMGDGSSKTDEVDVADFVPVYTVAEGSGLTLTGNEFGIDTSVIATKASVDAAQKAIDDYSTAHAGDYTNAQVDTKVSDAIAALNIGDYAKSADVVSNSAFGTFQTENTAAIAKAVSDQAAIDAELYATKTALEGVEATANAAATKTYVDTELGKKANADVVYTKSEIDIKIGTPGVPEVKDAEGNVVTEKTLGTGIFANAYSKEEINALLDEIEGGSTESAASVARDLETYISTNNNRVSLIEQNDATQNTSIKANADAITAINAADTGILAQAKTYADGLKTNIDTAYKAADTALGGRIDNVLALINGEGGTQAQITTLDGRVGAAESEVATLKTTVSGHTTTIGEHTTAIGNLAAEDERLAGLIAGNTAKFDSYYTKTEVDGFVGTINTEIGKKADAATTYTKTEVDNLLANLDQTELENGIKANADAIAVLNGVTAEDATGDTGKSVRAIAKEEVALIVGAAPEAMDTLEEVATWIANDESGAAAMANDIAANKAILAGFGTAEGEVATVKEYVDEAIAAATTPIATTEVAGAVKASDEVAVATDGKMTIAKVSTDVLVQGKLELILDGGNAGVTVTA